MTTKTFIAWCTRKRTSRLGDEYSFVGYSFLFKSPSDEHFHRLLVSTFSDELFHRLKIICQLIYFRRLKINWRQIMVRRRMNINFLSYWVLGDKNLCRQMAFLYIYIYEPKKRQKFSSPNAFLFIFKSSLCVLNILNLFITTFH